MIIRSTFIKLKINPKTVHFSLYSNLLHKTFKVLISKISFDIEKYKINNELTILLASHNMREVERLCDKVIMMKQGKIVDSGTCSELIKKHGRQKGLS